jgi:hypothetical protein
MFYVLIDQERVALDGPLDDVEALERQAAELSARRSDLGVMQRLLPR